MRFVDGETSNMSPQILCCGELRSAASEDDSLISLVCSNDVLFLVAVFFLVIYRDIIEATSRVPDERVPVTIVPVGPRSLVPD